MIYDGSIACLLFDVVIEHLLLMYCCDFQLRTCLASVSFRFIYFRSVPFHSRLKAPT